MKGDFSRMTFDVTKHFSRVLMQQGRVQVDADWNEQTAILLHYLQTLAKDLIGEHGGPESNWGFEIKTDTRINPKGFLIGKGRYYVDGMLVENEPLEFHITVDTGSNSKIILSAPTVNNVIFKKDQFIEIYNTDKSSSQIVNITGINTEKLELTVTPAVTISASLARRAVTYQTQDDYPLPSQITFSDGDVFLVYLDIWERHITSLDDDNIREVALGGSDTGTRAKLVWQIKITDIQPSGDGKLKEVKPQPEGQNAWRDWVDDTNENRWSLWKKQWQPANRGLLKARAIQDQKKNTDPCITSPESSYRGAENHLYRVEIHQGGNLLKGLNQKPTFKWSRDNGNTVTRIIEINGNELTVDSTRGFEKDQWLELINDNQELRGEPGLMVKITSNDCNTVKFARDNINQPAPMISTEPNFPTKARLWNSGEIQIIENDGDNWIKLEDGIEIQFQPSDDSSKPQHYRTGDYWLIPARVATGDVEWPGEPVKPEPLPPHGIEHHYAPLAIIKIDETPDVQADLRFMFKSVSLPIPP